MEKRNSGHLYAAALTAAAVVLAVRALYGFCWSDESFYLTFAQRLWNGQKLILDGTRCSSIPCCFTPF